MILRNCHSCPKRRKLWLQLGICKECISQDGKIIRYKVRLVAKSYTQKEGIDYNEVFSLVVKHSSNQILLALAAQYDLELNQLNAKTAFFYENLNEEINMTQLVEFKTAGQKS